MSQIAGFFKQFVHLSFSVHLIIGFLIRLVLIGYSVVHDNVAEVPYTDVDYRVFTDAARYIWNGQSPYERHTYRYSPLIAMLLMPNIYFFSFGKILFSIVDILVAYLIHKIVSKNITAKMKTGMQLTSGAQKSVNYHANLSMLFWLYNPLTIIIATRGNADSIAALLVLFSLYLLQCENSYFISGFVHGLACHLRIYPIVFSLAMYLHLTDFRMNSSEQTIKKKIMEKAGSSLSIYNRRPSTKQAQKKFDNQSIFQFRYLLYLVPNYKQTLLVSGAVISFSVSLILFYWMYGYKFLFETFIYHLIRSDTRHNFSIYFYLQYITADIKNVGVWHRLLTCLPNIVTLFVISVRYGAHPNYLYFCVFCEAVILVAYNSVMTSQYFIWFLSILPVVFWQIKMSSNAWLKVGLMWMIAQIAWLLPAYLLEFRGQNTFIFIWIQGVALFSAHIIILGRVVQNLSP